MAKSTAKAKVQKVPVSVRALVQRVNRKLAEMDERLCSSRPVFDVAGGDTERLRPIYDSNLGRFYVVGTRVNGIMRTDVDLEVLASELGCLAAYEALAE